MHRLILDAPDGAQVDHIDHDSLNNQRSNLRLCTCSENQRNRRGRPKNNTSGYIGVAWYRRCGRWGSQIWVNGKDHWLGLFDDPAEAARVRDAAAKRLHGEFATLNFEEGR